MSENPVPIFQAKKHAECQAAGDHLGKVAVFDRDKKKQIGFACTHCGAWNTGGDRPANVDFVTPDSPQTP